MASTRTYLFARVWTGYRGDADVSAFNDLGDDLLQTALDVMAAAWIRGHMQKPPGLEPMPAQVWAESMPEPPNGFAARVNESFALELGVRYATEFAQGPPVAPQWIVFHAESDLARATMIAKTLVRRLDCRELVKITLQERATLPPEQWMSFERELQDFESLRRVPRFHPSGLLDPWLSHPLKRLRDEALKLSLVLAEHGLPIEDPEQEATTQMAEPARSRPCVKVAAESYRWAQRTFREQLAKEQARKGRPLKRSEAIDATYRLLKAHLGGEGCPYQGREDLPPLGAWSRYLRDFNSAQPTPSTRLWPAAKRARTGRNP